MYYIVKNNEDNELINEYLLLKDYKSIKVEDEVIDRIFYYEKEKLYKLISKSIFDLPCIRTVYYWFEEKSHLESFISNIIQTTIKKYKLYYYELYVDFQRKLDNFTVNYNSRIKNTTNIDEQKSLTFTYINLEKNTNTFKHKYTYL